METRNIRRCINKKLTMAVLGLVVGLVGAPEAGATILEGYGPINANVPDDHGSNLVGTPNIGLTWVPNVAGDSLGFDGWTTWTNTVGPGPSGQAYQFDNSILNTITFTPDAGWNVDLISLDLNDHSGGGANAGNVSVDWSVVGSSSGPMGSGTFLTAVETNATHNINLTGIDTESLTLSLQLTTAAAIGWFALDNVTFDQVSINQASVPEPSSLILVVLGGLCALKSRHRRSKRVR